MGEFKVIKVIIKELPVINKKRYTLYYKVDECKFKYDSFEDNLTKEEFILKVKTEWENTKQ
jgi:hypothetical protein